MAYPRNRKAWSKVRDPFGERFDGCSKRDRGDNDGGGDDEHPPELEQDGSPEGPEHGGMVG